MSESEDGASAPRLTLGLAEAELKSARARITELEETLLGKQVKTYPENAIHSY